MSSQPFSFTDVQTAIANQANATQGVITALNASDQIIYDGAVKNYNLQMAAGQVGADKIPVPVAPFKWVAIKAPTDYTYWERSETERLTPTVPMQSFNALDAAHVVKVPGVIELGHSDGGGNFTVGPNDSWPGGIPTPPVPGPPDGQPHVYLKFSFAGLGWKYMKLS